MTTLRFVPHDGMVVARLLPPLALLAVLTDLAHQVVKDGEGAQKFVAVTVRGAGSVAVSVSAPRDWSGVHVDHEGGLVRLPRQPLQRRPRRAVTGGGGQDDAAHRALAVQQLEGPVQLLLTRRGRGRPLHPLAPRRHLRGGQLG